MARYSTAVVGLPGASNLFEALRTHLLANGWTEHDVITDTAGSQDSIFKGTALDATAGNAPFVRLTVTDTTHIGLRCYSDWETATHTGANVGGAIGWSYLLVSNTPFTYVIRANPVSFYLCAKLIGAYNKVYGGFLRRGYGTAKSGMTKTTAPYGIGVTSINVASDMTGKIRVGQYIDILNHSHTAGANFANGEKVRVASVAPGAIGISALTKAYDSGALVGANVYPNMVSAQSVTSNATGATYHPLHLDGSYTSATGQNGACASQNMSLENTSDPGDADNEYTAGVFAVTANTAGKTGTRGWMYHVLSAACDRHIEDVLLDGTNDYLLVATGTTAAAAVKRND